MGELEFLAFCSALPRTTQQVLRPSLATAQSSAPILTQPHETDAYAAGAAWIYLVYYSV